MTIEGSVISPTSLKGTISNVILRGYSAYQVAQSLGYEGTEEEWVESLKYDHSEEFIALKNEILESVESFDEGYDEKLAGLDAKFNGIVEDLDEVVEESKTELEQVTAEAMETIERKAEELVEAHVEGDTLVL